MSRDRVVVAAGVIIRDKRVLLIQRPASKSEFPLGWESPGGKVEHGESSHAALRRELEEELGIKAVLPEHAFWCESFENEPGCRHDFSILFYAITEFEGEPSLREGQAGFGWFAEDELPGLRLLPANRKALGAIQEQLR